MEPPLYKDLNDAMRTLDKTKLDTLGPYAACMDWALSIWSEKKRPDRMRVGEDDGLDGPLGKFS